MQRTFVDYVLLVSKCSPSKKYLWMFVSWTYLGHYESVVWNREQWLYFESSSCQAFPCCGIGSKIQSLISECHYSFKLSYFASSELSTHLNWGVNLQQALPCDSTVNNEKELAENQSIYSNNMSSIINHHNNSRLPETLHNTTTF